jgi:hypothetical protein
VLPISASRLSSLTAVSIAEPTGVVLGELRLPEPRQIRRELSEVLEPTRAVAQVRLEPAHRCTFVLR